MVSTALIGAALGAVLLLVASGRVFNSKDDRKQPPAVRSSIPLIGHIIGMIRHKAFYYELLAKQTDAPIFSIPILNSNLYIVSSPRLIPSVQRLTKALAFEPVMGKAVKAISGCSAKAEAVLLEEVAAKPGAGMLVEFSKAIHPTLTPGAALDSMNRIMVDSIAESANQLASRAGSKVNLFMWLRHELTLATTNSVYGPANPYKDPVIEDNFWLFHENVMALLINIIPSVTARAGVKARNIVSKAFEAYFDKNEHLNGSALVQTRYEFSKSYGIPVPDIATFEAGGSFALLANTFPTAYWMLVYIYSHPSVLDECRAEVLKLATTTTDPTTSTTHHSIDMTTIKTSCPVITATLQEVLRHTAVGSTIREVMEDTLLDGYLLKKGCTLLTPSSIIHNSPSTWGPNTDTFDHRRFLRTPGKKLPNPVAFRAFGGGATLCPGRHFATTEVLALATMFIARFDMNPCVGNEWPSPDRANIEHTTQILGPNQKFEVEARERKEWSEGTHTWTFSLTESEMLLAMAAEDMADGNTI